ncbi:cytochrome P450 [Fomitopsis serialis]|uniref:cytochrome P450 n=1 Tax=Fomitopsis serialis TaxID=139415 RepID=UPI0020087ADC|nr:cytochrome P450 [Neoantrodia serialis]KAH9929231.1 cytochrome P450 [Neoantrodia serialis]
MLVTMDGSLVASLLAGLVGLYVLADYVWPSKHSLAHIPTVGGPSFPILSSLGAFRYLFHAPEVLEEGYVKHKDGFFKHAEIGRMRWNVVVCSPEHIDELRKAADDQLSFQEATNESLQVDYTLGPSVHLNPYHIPIVRSNLTRALGGLFPALRDEIDHSFKTAIPDAEDWTKVNVYGSVMDIVCRTSNRLFVGLPLCRNEDYCALNKKFTIDVFTGARIINLFPNFLKPIAGRLFTNVPKSIRRGEKHLAPIIEERFKHEQGDEWEGKPNDMLQWLIDAAEGEERSIRALVLRMLTVNIAAIHTSSISFTQALLMLSADPGYLPALREEVEAIVREEGWTKGAMNKMRRVDSFLKETQRFLGLGAKSMARKALQDFYFSDGTYIPAGTIISAPSHSLHHDGHFYDNPGVFNPFRFARMRDDDGEGTRHQMVATSTDYVPFGHGRHACPGRFFAANELKAMLAHFVVTYDVKSERASDAPIGRWFGASLVPDRSAEVLVRKRQN